MLASIDFNDDLFLQTDEVNDVATDWLLSAKFPSVHLT